MFLFADKIADFQNQFWGGKYMVNARFILPTILNGSNSRNSNGFCEQHSFLSGAQTNPL